MGILYGWSQSASHQGSGAKERGHSQREDITAENGARPHFFWEKASFCTMGVDYLPLSFFISGLLNLTCFVILTILRFGNKIWEMKIVVRAPNWIGDSILAVPAVYSLRRNFPQAQIWIAAKSG